MLNNSFRIKSQLIFIDFNVNNECIIRQRYKHGIWEDGNYPYHDDVNNSHSDFEEKMFQVIDHLKEVSHKRRDIDLIFDFINKSTASNVTKESIEEIITDLVNKNLIINEKIKWSQLF